MGTPKFELHISRTGKVFFNLKAGNGETILSSEMYQSKSGAENGISSIKTNAPHDEQYQRRTASNGTLYFLLRARNGEPVGRSDCYTSTAAMENGIVLVKKHAPDAETVEA